MINLIVSSKTSLFHLSQELKKELEGEFALFQDEVDTLVTGTVDYMRIFITEHLHRNGSTGTLIRSINRYGPIVGARFGGSVGDLMWGIGNIDELNDNAPYWRLINFGGLSLPAQVGMGVPGSFNGNPPDSAKAGTGVGTDRFGPGSFMMFPKFPIEPMSYIENTEFFLLQQIDTLQYTK